MKLFLELNKMHRTCFAPRIKVLHLCLEMHYHNLDWNTARAIIFSGTGAAGVSPKPLTGSQQRGIKRAEMARKAGQ